MNPAALAAAREIGLEDYRWFQENPHCLHRFRRAHPGDFLDKSDLTVEDYVVIKNMGCGCYVALPVKSRKTYEIEECIARNVWNAIIIHDPDILNSWWVDRQVQTRRAALNWPIGATEPAAAHEGVSS